MSINIQQMLDNANGTVQLPVGEFEGPFFVRKPCKIIGTSTTLWTKHGSTLNIEAPNVKLENIRIEVTENSNDYNNSICLISKFNDTKYKDIDIVGNVSGVPNEDRQWDLPKALSFGEIPAQTISHFIIEIFVPTSVNIKSDITGISISPINLSAGSNKVIITVDAMKENTYIYGEIIFESIFLRKVYISGAIKLNINNFIDNKTIYKSTLKLSNNLVSAQTVSNVGTDLNIITLKKGQRLAIKDILKGKLKILFEFSSLIKSMDIDPYIFLLDINGKATKDENLIFFGNPTSKCNSVKYIENNKTIEIELDKVANNIQSISIAYSIYGDNPSNNFSKVISPKIRIFSDDKEKMEFSPTDLLIETTIVAIQFYRYKNEWKVNTVGSGYRDGLKKLCESYGLTVL